LHWIEPPEATEETGPRCGSPLSMCG
jgi:hypothetical protein